MIESREVRIKIIEMLVGKRSSIHACDIPYLLSHAKHLSDFVLGARGNAEFDALDPARKYILMDGKWVDDGPWPNG